MIVGGLRDKDEGSRAKEVGSGSLVIPDATGKSCRDLEKI